MTGRFAKGQSGNPSGRPCLAKPPIPSAFDIIIDRRLTVTQGGQEREITVEEALQQKTYQSAIGGSRLAQRQVMKMLAKYDAAAIARTPKDSGVKVTFEDAPPDNCDAALRILDIAVNEERFSEIKLQIWAVELALNRRRPRAMPKSELDKAQRATLDPASIRWPRTQG